MTIKLRTGLRLGEKTFTFTFDGKIYSAFEGDTAASALLAANVKLFGRSMKYRRPRGIISAGPEETNALLTCGSADFVVPNLPAPCLTVRDKMRLMTQNRWPSLHYDLFSLIGLGSGLFGAGFYYKTFIWPSWRTYEGIIRRLAGLGAAPKNSNLTAPLVEHLDCDVLVVGAGPAGLAAALAAARTGAHTVICEREPAVGGELEYEAVEIDGQSSMDWVNAAVSELQTLSVRLLLDTTVVGKAARLVIAHREPSGLADDATVYRIRAKRLVTATGAIEQFIAFIDNDRPGVMLLGAAERYLARYGVQVGKTVVLFGCHDRLYASAKRLIKGGMQVASIIDTRTQTDSKLRIELMATGVLCLLGHTVLAAQGGKSVHSVSIAPLDMANKSQIIDCDALLVSGGWLPDAHSNSLTSAGDDVNATKGSCRTEWGVAAGAANSAFDIVAALNDGFRAGYAAASQASKSTKFSADIESTTEFNTINGDPVADCVPFYRSPSTQADEKRQFIDFQNDVTVADLRQAQDHGFYSIEHVKRFTTLGIGTEQGRLSGALGAAILANLSGKSPQTSKPSRRRAPYKSATLSTLSGARRGMDIQPERRTVLHDWHVRNHAVMEDIGGWMRPRYYQANGNDPAVAALIESSRVRQSGGIIDASTLGKIEVAGPDAVTFIDRLYLTKASTIKPGRSKYMVLLREDGMVMDDGIVLRIAEDRFVATLGSGHAGQLLSHFELYQNLDIYQQPVPKPLRVNITDVTEAWSVIVVAGPKSRDSLIAVLDASWQEKLTDLSHMGFASGSWLGAEMRVLRASFSGELAFELHCRPAIVEALWQALIDAGMQPYGLEALDVLRVEKGYLTSSEINGQTSPDDLGLGAMVKLGNPCIGRALLDRPGLHSEHRYVLTGVKSQLPLQQFHSGAQLTQTADSSQSFGYVSSVVFSPVLEQWVGLALIERRHCVEGAKLIAQDPLRGNQTPVVITSTVHFDPNGDRMRS